jgi:hypothetical protein
VTDKLVDFSFFCGQIFPPELCGDACSDFSGSIWSGVFYEEICEISPDPVSLMMTLINTAQIHSAQNIFRAHLEFALQLGCAAQYNAIDTPCHGWCQDLRSVRLGAEITVPQLRAPSRCGSAPSRGILSRLKIHLVPKRQVEQRTSALWSRLSQHIGYTLIRVEPLAQVRLLNMLEFSPLLGIPCFMVQFTVGLNRKIPGFGLLTETAPTILHTRGKSKS